MSLHTKKAFFVSSSAASRSYLFVVVKTSYTDKWGDLWRFRRARVLEKTDLV